MRGYRPFPACTSNRGILSNALIVGRLERSAVIAAQEQIATQTYENMTIMLLTADPTFEPTLSTSGGTTYTGLASSEGGKIWTIDSITIPSVS